MTETKTAPIDLTRLNRAKRREMFGGNGKMLGRNLPYIKALHGSIQNYNELRSSEIEREVENTK